MVLETDYRLVLENDEVRIVASRLLGVNDTGQWTIEKRIFDAMGKPAWQLVRTVPRVVYYQPEDGGMGDETIMRKLLTIIEAANG